MTFRTTFSVLGKVPMSLSTCTCMTCWLLMFISHVDITGRNAWDLKGRDTQFLSKFWVGTMRWGLAMTGAQHSLSLRRVTASLETNAGSSLAAPVPLLTLLSNQPVDSSSSPASALSCVPLRSPRRCPRSTCWCGTQHPAVRPSHLWHFLSTSRGLEGTRADWALHPPFIPHTHYHPIRGKKVKNKKIFCTEIYFYYAKFVQYQKRKEKKKGVNFFSLS